MIQPSDKQELVNALSSLTAPSSPSHEALVNRAMAILKTQRCENPTAEQRAAAIQQAEEEQAQEMRRLMGTLRKRAQTRELTTQMLTPQSLASAQTQFMADGRPITHLFTSFDFFNDMRTDPEFATMFDPATKHDMVMSGTFGNMFGMILMSDAFEQDVNRVLEPGEFFLIFCREKPQSCDWREVLASAAVYPRSHAVRFVRPKAGRWNRVKTALRQLWSAAFS